MKMINNQLRSIGIDANKMPLGKIAKSCIIKGYEALKELIEEIKSKRRKESISQWSNAFYSQIPHDFGMKNICNYVLDTEKKIKDKLEMLQSLEDMQVFSKLIDEANFNS
jgi:poly [ADP-ribose] polymerase